MDWHVVGIVGSIFTFAGGALLSLDLLAQPKRRQQESGARQFLDILNAHGLGKTVKDEQGRELDSVDALDQWFARQTRRLARGGVFLMTFGFLLDVLERWHRG